MSKNDPRKALGKGLHSLLPPRAATAPPPAADADAGSVFSIPTDRIQPNPDQPRRAFDPAAMLELTQSIERDGIIQPIIVRRTGPRQFQIIAGERRWRAAKSAGLKEVPVIVRTADDRQALELAIIENIQREDLNPMELALAFERMASELGLSHDQIGEKTSKDRATVTNTIRLLQLPPDIQDLIAARQISPGHARALLKLPDDQSRRAMADRCIREGWSVRQIENYTRSPKSGRGEPAISKREPAPADPNVTAAVDEMQRTLGTRVKINEKGKNKGTVEIEYYSADDLDRIYNIIVAGA